MNNHKIALKEAIKFHGHLGPYLVLGLLAGETALKKLRCNKCFGLNVLVWGADKKPKSCLIDGLQLSTGATYGKGNIHKIRAQGIRISVLNLEKKKKISLSLKNGLISKLNSLKGHIDCEAFARKLYRTDPLKIFKLKADC